MLLHCSNSILKISSRNCYLLVKATSFPLYSNNNIYHGGEMTQKRFIKRMSPDAYSNSSNLKYVHVPCRSFKVKSSQTPLGNSNTSNKISEESVSETVKNLMKNLGLSSKEAMSIRMGLMEGLRMKTSNEKDDQSETKAAKRVRYWILLTACGVIFYTLVKGMNLTIESPIKKLVSFSGKDFKAEIPDVSFDDVKGIDEVKQELLEVVDFLQDPDRFTNLGGKLPKGMLLVGPPGTGKTLLARAIAGEAGVPFYYASGSEFDEMFVGVGSARIRKLFADARENAPCIIFIDEIDACGNKRTSSPLQPYARQTINQLLQEMDGFEVKESVIVLGATNMANVLDKALTRPGRFDTEINVLPPDIKGRKEILELYAKKVVHANNLNLEKIACLTGGMTGADLANLVNQAALRAAQLKKSFVDMDDFEFALDKLRLGPEIRSRVPTESELENTAFHEAGHALVAYHTPNTMPIYKATVRQRGPALGHVSQIPTREDENTQTSAKILAQIDVAMGGRVAEEIMKGKEHVSTGASSDLVTATKLAYTFICQYGMSENLGFVAYNYETASPATKQEIEKEVNKILEASYKKAKGLLTKFSDQHKLLAQALIKYETLTLNEINVILTSKNLNSVSKLRNSVSSPNHKQENSKVGDIGIITQ